MERLDFENQRQRFFDIGVRIENDATAPTDIRIVIRLNNIFDNDPTIIYDGPCKAVVRKSTL